MSTDSRLTHAVCVILLASGCSASPRPPYREPAKEFADAVRGRDPQQLATVHSSYPQAAYAAQDQRAKIRWVSDELPPDGKRALPAMPQAGGGSAAYGSAEGGADGGYYMQRSSTPDSRAYQGPLALGEPGSTASLYREGRSNNDLYRDHRAFQVMDLITIKVMETSEGKKEADTEVKSESTLSAAISALFGLENYAADKNNAPNVALDPSNLISAEATNEFKGEGETNRKDSLKGTISAVVVEVLPSGIMRIEGEKIISVNAEEQIMKISGLVRPRDVNSANEVLSTKIANVRIDYYGRGTVDEAQYGGWASRILRRVWPF